MTFINIRSINKLEKVHVYIASTICQFQPYNVWILLKTVMKYLHYRCYITVKGLGKLATCRCMYITSTICQLTGIFSYNIWILFKSNNKISTLIYLQNNTDVISRYGCNSNTHVHHVDPVYVRKFTCLFIDRIFINFMGILFHLISSEL